MESMVFSRDMLYFFKKSLIFSAFLIFMMNRKDESVLI